MVQEVEKDSHCCQEIVVYLVVVCLLDTMVVDCHQEATDEDCQEVEKSHLMVATGENHQEHHLVAVVVAIHHVVVEVHQENYYPQVTVEKLVEH